jgi:RNA polymerase sigma-70 factor (ECF subfamily)
LTTKEQMMIGSLTIATSPAVAARDHSFDDRFLLLLDECERPLYAYLTRLLGDRDVAQDCAQDTLIRAHDAMKKGQTISRQWVFRVAHNRAMDEFRRRSKVRNDMDALDQIPARESTDGSVAVRDIMDRLDPLDRQVLELFVIEGFKTDEIGEMLGVRGSAVRQRLYRARERFRVLYGKAA